MLTASLIFLICGVLLLSYFFDISAKFTRVPSVILLILLGLLISIVSKKMNVPQIDLSQMIPVLGTFGLILIVLDESFEIHLDKKQLPVIKKSLIVAVVPMFILTLLVTTAFCYFKDIDWHTAIVNAIPVSIISSAIAIPSVSHLKKRIRDFVTFESSLSDIIGVVLFNFFALNAVFNGETFLIFFAQTALMIIISLVASLLLSFLLSKIDHHIKFVPIIVLVILIYELAKVYHLPALIFILIFGIFIGNLDLIKRKTFVKLLHPEKMHEEVVDFKNIVAEGTFLVRTLFFVVFGYLIDLEELLNIETIEWSIGIVIGIFLVRIIQLKLIKLPVFPLLFVAPRGLITILLFLAIPTSMSFSLVNKSLIIQVIIITVFVMMIGMLFYREKIDETQELTDSHDELNDIEPIASIDLGEQ